MSHPLEGVMKVITGTVASAGAGMTYVAVRPPEGCVWEVEHLYGYQDDGAVVTGWYLTDTKESISRQIMDAGTGAASVYWSLGCGDDGGTVPSRLHRPLVITYQTYLEFGFNASAGAKNGTYKGIVREFRGVQSAI